MSTQGVTITVNAESDAAAATLQRFFTNTIEGFDHLSGATRFLEELAGKIIAGLSVAAVVEFTREAINAAEAMGVLSRQVGFSIQTLSALKVQANENGIQFEELRIGLTHFNEVLNLARQQGGPAMESIRNLSHEIAVAVAQGKPAEVVYRMIAQRFKEMPDGIQKTAAAQLLFGRASAKWVTLLNEGAEGMEKVKALGGGVTPEAVANATDFNRTLRELHEQLEIVFLNLSQQILPTLQQVVNWLKTFTEQENITSNATAALVNVFKGLVTVGLVVGAVFVDIGKMIGVSAEGWVEIYKTALAIVQQIAAQIKNIYVDIINLAADMVDTLVTSQAALASALSGHFDVARSLIKTQLGGIKEDVDALGHHAAAAFGNIPAELQKLVSTAKALNEGLLSDVIKQWAGISNFIGNLWTKTGAPKPKPGASGAGAPVAGAANGPLPSGDQDKIDAARLELDREKIQLQEKIISTDPTLTQAERLQKLLPYLIQENDLLAKQIAQQKSIANDPSRTELERVAANREIVKLQTQQLQLSIQMVQAVHPWQTAMAGAVQRLRDMNNLAQETATAFEHVFNTAIQSISDNLSKVIEGTETWGQALRNIGSAILNEIISAIVQMAIRWIVTSLMMAAFGEGLVTSTAAIYSAAWAGPAILSTIASYGAAASAAGPEVMGAMAFAPLITAVAREHGGPAEAGQLIMAGERGRELIVPRSASHVFNADDTARLVSMSRSSSAPHAAQPAQPKISVNFFSDPNALNKHARENPDFHHIMVDVFRRNVHIVQPAA